MSNIYSQLEGVIVLYWAALCSSANFSIPFLFLSFACIRTLITHFSIHITFFWILLLCDAPFFSLSFSLSLCFVFLSLHLPFEGSLAASSLQEWRALLLLFYKVRSSHFFSSWFVSSICGIFSAPLVLFIILIPIVLFHFLFPLFLHLFLVQSSFTIVFLHIYYSQFVFLPNKHLHSQIFFLDIKLKI